MLKLQYTCGMAFIGVSALAIAMADPTPAPVPTAPPPRVAHPPVRPPTVPVVSTGQWFAQIKPFCNSVEVETAYSRTPAPSGLEGMAYGAACFALAGKIDRARELIETLNGSDRARAAGIVFEIAHPVADAGDDKSAGPIMAMVVEFWPNHYMALYHAGMSEFALGDPARARAHLTSFLQYYTAQDGWRSSAIATLEKLKHAEAEPQ